MKLKVLVVLALVAWLAAVYHILVVQPASRETEIRRIATDVACRSLVEAGLVRSCTPSN